MNFTVNGSFRMGSREQNFSIRIEAEKEEHAVEKVYAELGGRHGCKRRFIKIEGVSSGESKNQ